MIIIFKEDTPNILQVQLDEGMVFNVKMNPMASKIVNLGVNSIITPKLIEQNLEYIEKIVFNYKEEEEELLNRIDPQKVAQVREISLVEKTT